MSSTELWRLTAAEVIARLEKGEVSPLDLVEAAAARIEATDDAINAMPTLCLERAREQAKKITAESTPDPKPRGWLGGLPVAVKDLNEVSGVRTTFGSPIFESFVPEASEPLVARIEERGAITIGKSNTPEFGAGASTFNEVFGRTCNPWNTDKSVAGSSGGSGAALAAGQVWLATGSDLGGSLRTPASFNGVIGLRPSPGRVPKDTRQRLYSNLSVEGPMARTALDCAILLDAMSGWTEADPMSLPEPELPFAEQVWAAAAPKRVAFSPDLGGITPVDPQVAEICRAAAAHFEGMGSTVEETSPDFSGATETFQVLRAAGFAFDMAPTLAEHRDKLKPEVIWNIEKGLALTADDIGRAERERARIYHGMLSFFETYDLLLCPTAIVPPYPVEWRYVEEIGETRFETYIDWIAIVFALSLTTCPTISAPAGMTEDGLPVGLQIAGPPREEGRVLGAAHLLEQATGLSAMLPIDPRPPAS